MEFQGRIAKLLPIRQGVSQRTGNEWKSLPFIFEYFENASDRYADSVMLETFDTKVIENLKEGMEVRCGFGHKTREYTKDGKTMILNDIRLYKIESVHKEQPAGQATGAGAQQQGATPAPQQQGGGDDDDLPF
jgi:hypothetical protein